MLLDFLPEGAIKGDKLVHVYIPHCKQSYY